MAKTRSFGIRCYVDGIFIGGLTDLSITGGEVTFVDTTCHESSDDTKEYVSGLKDGGSLDLTGKYDYNNAGQEDLRGGLGSEVVFSVVMSDNSGVSFDAVIGGFNTGNPLDNAVEFTSTAKITGEITDMEKTRMTVSGSLTDGTNPVVFSELVYAGLNGTKNRWTPDGTTPHSEDLFWAVGKWWLSYNYGAANWTSTDDVATPDLVTTWTPAGSETGTPTITDS